MLGERDSKQDFVTSRAPILLYTCSISSFGIEALLHYNMAFLQGDLVLAGKSLAIYIDQKSVSHGSLTGIEEARKMAGTIWFRRIGSAMRYGIKSSRQRI